MNIEEKIDETVLLRYFAGESTAEEIEIVEKWMAASDEHKRLASQIYYIQSAKRALGALRGVDAQNALKSVRRRMLRNRFVRIGNVMQRIAAVIAIPLIVSTLYLLLKQDEVSSLIELKTSPGMVASATLPDGTVVTLNSNSKLTYPAQFKGDSRCVALDGEAYFDVAKDAKHQFRVSTPQNAVIKVYGTGFNVEAYSSDDKISATLVHGSISMSYENNRDVWKERKIVPGQEIVYEADSRDISVVKADIDVATSWRDGKLVFHNTSFDDALKMLSKRFDVDFEVKNKKYSAVSLTGVISNQHLDRVLEYISMTANMKFRCVESDDVELERQRIVIY